MLKRSHIFALLLAMLALALPASAQTTFVATQTFTGTANADLTTYTGSGGVTFARNGAFSSRPVILTGNNTIREGDTTGLTALYVASATPPNADYYVQGDLKYLGSAGGSDINGVVARYDASADTGYFFAYRQSIASWILYKHVAGAATSLVTASAATLTNGSTYTIKLVCNGTTISGYVNKTLTLTQTDTSIAGPGQAGVFLQGTSAVTQTNTSGYQLTNFTAATNVTVVASNYTASPSAGSVYVNTPITISLAANGAATNNVTTAEAGVSGSFSTNPNALNGTATVTYTYTPTTTGTAVFSFTNDSGGSVANPSNFSVTVTNPPITYAVNSTGFRFSPGNWTGDSGRGGSVWRAAWTAGAYFDFTFSTTSGSPSCIINVTNQTATSYVSYICNGGTLQDAIATPTTGGITISGLVTGTNTVRVYCRNSQQINRWNLANAWKVTGATCDSSSTIGTAAAYQPWVRFISDSKWEGIQTLTGAGNDDQLESSSFYIGQAIQSALGYDYSQNNCGYNGWEKPGDTGGDVPGLYVVSGGTYSAGSSRWHTISGYNSGVSDFDTSNHHSAYGSTGQEPIATIVEMGTNEAQNYSTYSTSDTQASVNQWLTAERSAAPNEWIFVVVPYGLYNTSVSTYSQGPAYITAIKAGVAAYQSSVPSDTKVKLIDLGASVANLLLSTGFRNSDGVHPTALGHAYLAPLIAGPIISYLKAAVVTQGIRLRRIN